VDPTQEKKGSGGGGGAQRAITGIQAGISVTPADLRNKQTMSGMTSILFVGSLFLVSLFKIVPVVDRVFFGIKPGDKPATPELNRGVIFKALHEGNPDICNDSALKGIFKEGWGKMSEEAKANIKEFINK
jgi:hypothetical protein